VRQAQFSPVTLAGALGGDIPSPFRERVRERERSPAQPSESSRLPHT